MKDGHVIKIGTMDKFRSYYRSTLTAKSKHSLISKSEQLTLKQWLHSVGKVLETTESYLTITLDHEKKIAEIIRAFSQYKIDVYM
ncbi:hypothetical protein KHA93_18385 [Bacillus sp. FJAT-49732]|uniref:Uncharacterized protein n=1 Tax=Lederbergia citrisecunda TaxID=2833583 RepID=A0A942TTQ5_9BACI|nr:hypothetical protein [Lederbergia citrisecunda]MBS4201584.1 hypothetical protein [Lederbergia citrisecunda]